MPDHVIRAGLLVVVSGPSGSGKTTLCRALHEAGEVRHAISATTRPPREGEADGRDYHFLTEPEFLRRIEAGELLEFAMVHTNYYGTLKSEVLQYLEAGTDVVMDLDFQGAASVRKCVEADESIRLSLVDVFILPPSIDELKERLANRNTEGPDEVTLRLRTAMEEMKHWRAYQYTMISGDREDDLANFRAIIQAERQRSSRLRLSAASGLPGADAETGRSPKP